MDNCLNEFGEVLIKEVRDRTIRLFDKKVQGAMKDKDSQLLFERVNKLSKEQQLLINEIIPPTIGIRVIAQTTIPDTSNNPKVPNFLEIFNFEQI